MTLFFAWNRSVAQAGTQWVDNPTPPPVQDMVSYLSSTGVLSQHVVHSCTVTCASFVGCWHVLEWHCFQLRQLWSLNEFCMPLSLSST